MKNSLRNLLWFYYSPADERESLIYQKAYHWAFAALLLQIGVAIYLLSLFESVATDAPAAQYGYILIALIMMLCIGYLSGWLALRKEELTLEYKQIPPTQAFKHIMILVVAALIALLSIGLYKRGLIPEMSWIVPIVIGCLEVAFVWWAWHMTKPMPMPSRIVALLLFSPGIIFFMARKKKSLWRFIESQFIGIVLYIVLFAVILTPIIFSTLTILTLFRIETDHFAPELTQGTEIMVEMVERTPSVEDYVIFKTDSAQLYLGKVTSVDGQQLVVDSSMGERKIPKEQLVGIRIDLPESEPEYQWTAPESDTDGEWTPALVY